MYPSRNSKRTRRQIGTSVSTVNLGLNYGVAGSSVSGTANLHSQKLGTSDDLALEIGNSLRMKSRSNSSGLTKSRVRSPTVNDRPASGDSFYKTKVDDYDQPSSKSSWQAASSPYGKAKQTMQLSSKFTSQNSSFQNSPRDFERSLQRGEDPAHPMNKSSPHFYLPGDRVIFTEDIAAPGIPVIYRIEDERRANPDKLNLDRRGLTICPIIEGEEGLRLLNFQHNLIQKIENLTCFRKLIFLDLYDNQIDGISGLSSLKSLRVLMLGKNRIKKIDNLHDLLKLDVLDLHGNKIVKIENLSHLLELRVLNLAGNEISVANNLSGLESLTELNLRRNKIGSVYEINLLPSLQRLFLSYNEIKSFQGISCLTSSTSLTELSLDGNPFANDSLYKQTILQNVLSIKQLDMKKISDEERRIVSTMARKEDEKRREIEKISSLKERRQLAINNAKRQFRSQIFKSSNAENELKDKSEDSTTPRKTSSNKTDYSVCHLAELDDNRLNFYGPGSLEAVDRNWGEKAASSVTFISFHFIHFDSIVPFLSKIKNRFVNVSTLSFGETNICHFNQISALANLRALEELVIEEAGNTITEFSMWKPFVLYRLSHLSLQKINGSEVTTRDSVHAEKVFGALGHVMTSQLLQSRLISMLAKQKKSGIIQDGSKGDATADFLKRGKTSNSGEPVGRAGLMYQQAASFKQDDEDIKERKKFSRQYINEVINNASISEQKREQFEMIWPKFFEEYVQRTAKEMSCLDRYMESSLERIKRC
ncbi:leucine-rich repeat-containing protein 49-like [Rhopilema esculentum]|uniref:leucine-rich repeat-containing protein 49-like n=1 Tax=Rhopilema esculentum TaxID=499914 RepID=UPI0031D173CE